LYLHLIVLTMIVLSTAQAAAEKIRLDCIADAPMYGHSQEKEVNWGAASSMRIKDYQGIAFMQFDFDAIRGKRVVSCSLFVTSRSGQSAFCTDLISTIAVPWYEGTGNGNAENGSSTYTHRVWPDSLWSGAGSDARSVVNGDSTSLVNSLNICFAEGGSRASVVIDTELAQQLIDNRAFGLALFGKSATINRDIYSREQTSSAPYLEIEVIDGESVSPETVADLAVSDSSRHGVVTLGWTAPGDDGPEGWAGAYEFRMSDNAILTLVDWDNAVILENPPLPDTAGSAQDWVVDGLPAGSEVFISLRTRDEKYNWSGISNSLQVLVPLDQTGPVTVSDLSASPGSGPGEVSLNWTAPGDDGDTGRVDSYQLRYGLNPVDQSNWDAATVLEVELIPSDPGGIEQYLVSGLESGSALYFAIRARDEAGNLSAVSNSVQATPASGVLKVWAAPSYWKINPRNGNAFEIDPDNYNSDNVSRAYQQLNRIWDGATEIVTVSGGRNEFVAFQLVIENLGGSVLEDVSVSISDLTGPSVIDSSEVRLYREWYHKFDGVMYPDLLAPFDNDGGTFQVTPFSVPDPQFSTFGQVAQLNQAVFADIYVPHKAVAGTYTATITVSTGSEGIRRITVMLEVLDFELSDYTHYGTEFNCYSDIGKGWNLPHDWNTATSHDSLERVVQRMLHEHRVFMDRMPYSHNPTNQASFRCAPVLNGASGDQLSIQDWTDYDRRFGPYFDGSAFAGNPRDGIPIPFYYLPFHTEWPVRMPLPRGSSVFSDQAYIDGFTGVVTDFERHIDKMGWHRTTFFAYNNEKAHWGYQPWDLDEPTVPADYEALNFYAGMLHNGIRNEGGAEMLYRCDMGHFSYMRGELDQQMDVWVINRGDYPESQVRERIADGDVSWTYGDAPRIAENMAENYFDFFWNWSRAARGYVYWDSFQAWSGDAWNDNHDGSTNLFYPGMAGDVNMLGHTVCPSLRMKAIRDYNEIGEMFYIMQRSRYFSALDTESIARRYLSTEMESYADAEAEIKRLADGLGDAPQEPPSRARVCDFNGDSLATIHDVITLMLAGYRNPADSTLDVNGDGIYTIQDVAALLENITMSRCVEGGGIFLASVAQVGAAPEFSSEEILLLEQQFALLKLSDSQQAELAALLHPNSRGAGLPKVFTLGQNTPNPFNPSTSISYQVPQGRHVKVLLEVYNIRGMKVCALIDAVREPGEYTLFWDGRDEAGRKVASGVYFYRLRAGDFTQTRKMVILK
jgi:hypothetical protein